MEADERIEGNIYERSLRVLCYAVESVSGWVVGIREAMGHLFGNEFIPSHKPGVAYWAKDSLRLDVDDTYENLWIKPAIPERKP